MYDVLMLALQTRLRGTQPRSETTSVKPKLRLVKKQSLVQWIPDPHRRMTDALLASRSQNIPPLI
jgi:hypothetical protein